MNFITFEAFQEKKIIRVYRVSSDSGTLYIYCYSISEAIHIYRNVLKHTGRVRVRQAALVDGRWQGI